MFQDTPLHLNVMTFTYQIFMSFPIFADVLNTIHNTRLFPELKKNIVDIKFNLMYYQHVNFEEHSKIF